MNFSRRQHEEKLVIFRIISDYIDDDDNDGERQKSREWEASKMRVELCMINRSRHFNYSLLRYSCHHAEKHELSPSFACAKIGE